MEHDEHDDRLRSRSRQPRAAPRVGPRVLAARGDRLRARRGPPVANRERLGTDADVPAHRGRRRPRLWRRRPHRARRVPRAGRSRRDAGARRPRVRAGARGRAAEPRPVRGFARGPRRVRAFGGVGARARRRRDVFQDVRRRGGGRSVADRARPRVRRGPATETGVTTSGRGRRRDGGVASPGRAPRIRHRRILRRRGVVGGLARPLPRLLQERHLRGGSESRI